MSARPTAGTPPTSVPKLELERKRFQLECGAVLIVSPRPGAPVTAMRVHFRGGPSLDEPGKEGLAYLVGGLIDQGTEDHTEAEIASILEPAGGEVSGDSNGLSGTIAGGAWKLLLSVVTELMTRPTYPDTEVGRQKQRLLSRLIVERDEPRTQGAKLFRKLVYGSHWLGRPAYGSIESVSSITPKDLRARHSQHWTGRRCIIAVCGDVRPNAVRRELEKLLGDWNPGEPFVPKPAEFPERGGRIETFPAERKQVHLYLGHLGIQRVHESYPGLVVMDHILGTGPGFWNRIARKLRDEQGLAYSVSADIHSSCGILPGMFTAYIGTSPEHVPTAIDGFLREIREIQANRVSDRELNMAKSYLLGSFVLGFERSSRRANYLVSAELHDFPEDNLAQLPKQFAAVTAAEVQRVASEHLFPDACCVSASGPISKKVLAGALPR